MPWIVRSWETRKFCSKFLERLYLDTHANVKFKPSSTICMYGVISVFLYVCFQGTSEKQHLFADVVIPSWLNNNFKNIRNFAT